MHDQEITYAAKRAREERAAAENAADPRSAAAHKRLAAHYEALIRSEVTSSQRSGQ